MSRLHALARLPLISGAALLLCSGVASATVIWRGDFSTGDISQWTGAQEVSPSRLEVIRNPLGGSNWVLQATVEPGDNPIGASGNRNELYWEGDNVNVGAGQIERYYHWRTMWPTDYVSPDTWQLFTQWHQYDGGGSPPVEMYLNGENVILTVQSVCGGNSCSTPTWETSLQRGVWHDFVLDVNWSEDPSLGYFQLWYDGNLVMGKTNAATLMSGGDGVYLKQGLYRNASIANTQIVYHTGMTVATTLEDVMPLVTTDGASSSGTTTTAEASSSGTTTTAEASSSDSSSTAPISVKYPTGGCAQAGGVAAMGLFVGLLGLFFRRSRALRSGA